MKAKPKVRCPRCGEKTDGPLYRPMGGGGTGVISVRVCGGCAAILKVKGIRCERVR